MSDLLTHWAVFEDCRRLAPLDPGIEGLFKELLEAEQDYARLGAITRGGNRFMTEVLARARDARRAGDELQARKVAFCLGCVTHQACDHLMKPLMKARAPAHMKREISAYYDTHVFREVYLNGQEEPFSRFLFSDNETEPGRALEAFSRSLFQRALLSSHTLKPDHADVEGWLERLFDTLQELYISTQLYVRVFEHPDPAKRDEYGVETAFYREGDPTIRVARALGRGEPVSPEEAAEALRVDANESAYAQAVALSLSYLRNASAFWHRKTDVIEARNVVWT